MPAHAQKRYRHIYIHIYIYTHRESLVRNHEPRAKALGNYLVCEVIVCFIINVSFYDCGLNTVLIEIILDIKEVWL